MSRMEVLYERLSGWSDWQFPLMRGYRQGCCDCGLACDVEFRILYKGKPVSAQEYRVIYRCRRSFLTCSHIAFGMRTWSKWHTTPNDGIMLEGCLDCSLIHDMNLRVVRVLTDDHRNGYTYRTVRSHQFEIQMRARRNTRSTGQLRRYA